jgi:hypothetical protein
VNISQHINQLVFLIGTRSVLCEVGTESLCINHTNVRLLQTVLNLTNNGYNLGYLLKDTVAKSLQRLAVECSVNNFKWAMEVVVAYRYDPGMFPETEE